MVPKRILAYLVVSALILASLFLAFEMYRAKYGSPPGRCFELVVRVTYENRGGESWNLREDDMILGLFVNNSWQTAYLMGSSHPAKSFHRDPDGNPVMALNLGDGVVSPGGRLSYNATYKLVYRERRLPEISEEASGTLDDIPIHLKEEYCRPTSLWQSNISTLRETALLIAGNETRALRVLKNFIAWIAGNIGYESSEVPRYPIETFSQRLGDCDDQANLLITFCRAVGIPAYLQIGCIYMPWYERFSHYWSGHLLIRQVGVGWHGWAVVYVPPWGWLPVDLTYVEGDLRSEPLNAIICSAVIKHPTFQYINITITDYVSETRLLKEFLEGSEFYVYEENIMEVIWEQCPMGPLPTGLLSMRIIYISTAVLRKYAPESEFEWRSLS